MLQASLGVELASARKAARLTGRARLEAELATSFPMTLSAAEVDAAASFVAAAGITSAWGSASLQAIAAESPLSKVAQEIASSVDRTVSTEVARAFNDERNTLIVDFGMRLGEGDGDDGTTSRLSPGMFKVYSAILDGRTCPRCFAADGEVIELQASFKAGAPPLHPRCRCIIEHVIVPKPQRLEDVRIDYELFKSELRDVIRENRIISDRQALSFVSDSMGKRRSAEVLARRFDSEAYATREPTTGNGRVRLITPRKTP